MCRPFVWLTGHVVCPNFSSPIAFRHILEHVEDAAIPGFSVFAEGIMLLHVRRILLVYSFVNSNAPKSGARP